MDKNDNLEIKVAECVFVNGGYAFSNPDITDDIKEVRMLQAGHLYYKTAIKIAEMVIRLYDSSLWNVIQVCEFNLSPL